MEYFPISNLSFNKFDKRCKMILNELKKAEKKTGKKKFYLCNITHSNIEEMARRAKLIKKNGGVFIEF